MIYSTIQIGQSASTIRKQNSRVRCSRLSDPVDRSFPWPHSQGRIGGCSQFYGFRALLPVTYRQSLLATAILDSVCKQNSRYMCRGEFHNSAVHVDVVLASPIALQQIEMIASAPVL
jgi:hypothetical protein